MDSRITKKRLSEFLSYEWIFMIVVAVAAIIVMELLFTVISVRTTEGQRFNYFYDENVSSKYDETFYEIINRNTFSFDVKEISSESLTSDYNVLSVRLTTNDGDAIFTDTFDSGSDGNPSIRANTIIDSYKMFTFGDDTDEESILYSAKEYLSKFLAAGKTDPTDYANLDESKIAARFDARTKKERVYRNDINAGRISVSDEYDRIKKLCEEVSYFEKVLNYDKTRADGDSIFYSYKRFEQTVINAGGENKPNGYDESIAKNYGINITKLGEKAKRAFAVKDTELVADVVVLAFDFKSVIPDLQYETLSFINSIIRNYADFADAL